MRPDPFDEARRLDALSCRALIPTTQTLVDPKGVLPSVEVPAERPALFVMPESLLPPRVLWDDAEVTS